jgi:hypothetical protein
MAWILKWLPTILRWLAPLLAAGGVINAQQMYSYENFDLTNWGITGGYFAAAIASAIGLRFVPSDGETTEVVAQRSAAKVKQLRAQAAALNAQADAITKQLQAEATEAEASK